MMRGLSEEPQDREADVSGLRALLVEDSPLCAESVKMLLARHRTVAVDLTHVECLRDVQSDMQPRPDIVLLDLGLPDAQGLDTIRGVQARLPGTPIVVLTAESSDDLALDVVRNGAQDYLVKGRFDVDTLIRAMRYAIERVRSEDLKRRLLQADRLVALGRLAAGVAHEISNPATFVQASGSLLEASFQRLEVALEQITEAVVQNPIPPEPVLHAVQAARDAGAQLRYLGEQNAIGIDRICSVVRDLRGFSRLEPGEPVPIHPNEVIGDVLRLVANVVRHKAHVLRTLTPVPPIALPRGRLDQILTNLIMNAVQALPETPRREGRISVATHLDGVQVVIVVEDTGVGMSLEQQRMIFEPFFTTKPGVGVGLGLSICREIARAHRGDVTCVSEEGRGTRFEVRFPAMDKQEARGPAPLESPVPRRLARPRLLIVDDEPNIRGVYSTLLRDEFDVVTAKGGTEALALVTEGAGFDVIVSDLMMPDMDAAELIDSLARLDPGVVQRFILYTGGAVSESARRLVDAGKVPVLFKPLLVDDLKRAVWARIADR